MKIYALSLLAVFLPLTGADLHLRGLQDITCDSILDEATCTSFAPSSGYCIWDAESDCHEAIHVVAAAGEEGGFCQEKFTVFNNGREKYATAGGNGCDSGLKCTVTNDLGDEGIFDGTCEHTLCHGQTDPEDLTDGDSDASNEATVRVTICHRTCSETNPWVRITIDDDAWNGTQASGCGHQQHDITVECSKYADSDWAAWGKNRRDYLIKWHGTRDFVRTSNGWDSPTCNNGGHCDFGTEEKNYWFEWERACPYVRHGACCGTRETGACCGDNPYVGYNPEITLEKTVKGNNEACDVDPGMDLYAGLADSPIRYCYKITNNGNTVLCDIVMDDPDKISGPHKVNLNGDLDSGRCLSAGGVVWAMHDDTTLPGPNGENFTAHVVGIPSWTDDLTQIDSLDPVTDTNAAAVLPQYAAGIDLQKTVKGDEDSCETSSGGDTFTAAPGSDIRYCYKITNTGDTILCDIDMSDIDKPSGDHVVDVVGDLDSGRCLSVDGVAWATPHDTKLPGPTGENVSADVIGTPSWSDFTTLVGVEKVTDSDPAEVLPVYTATIELQKTVMGINGYTDPPCADDPGMELYIDEAGSNMRYCYKIINTGTTILCDIDMSDIGKPSGDHVVDVVGDLNSGNCLSIGGEAWAPPNIVQLPSGGENFTAIVTGTPSWSDFTTLAGLEDVTDADPAAVEEPVEDIPLCVMEMTDTGATVCAGGANTVKLISIKSDPAYSVPSAYVLLYGLTHGVDDSAPEVSFKVDNPFDFAVDMYVQYSKRVGLVAYDTHCFKELNVPGCDPSNSDVITAACVAGPDPFAIVKIYFVSTGFADNFSSTSQVDECCAQEAGTTTNAVVEYTLEIECACPMTE